MIDRPARDQLALALRRLAVGRITNEQFDDCAYEPFTCRPDGDPALSELAAFGWVHYSDLWPYRLRGRRALAREQRRAFARAVLFFKTDQAYVFGESLASDDDDDCGGPTLPPTFWPFASREAYQAALRSPPFLAGRLRAGIPGPDGRVGWSDGTQ